MSDMFDALLGGSQIDPAELAQRLRQQTAMGTLGALSGVEGLQKLGPQMIEQASKGAQDYATLQERASNQGLQRALQMQGQRLEDERARTAELDRGQRAQDSNDLRRQLSADSLAARQAATNDKATVAQEKLDLAKKAKTDAAENISAMYDDMITKAQQIKDDPALSRATGLMDYFHTVKGTPAANVEANIHSLSSETALNAIQALRQNGGTLGRVTNMEIPLLQSSTAPLSNLHNMSPEDAQKALQHLIDYATGARKRLRTAAGIVDESAVAPSPTGGMLPRATGMIPTGNPNETNPAYNADIPPMAPQGAVNPNMPAGGGPAKTVVRSGTKNGKRVVQYSDGSISEMP